MGNSSLRQEPKKKNGGKKLESQYNNPPRITLNQTTEIISIGQF
jgi:hypothetical protein